MPNSVDSLLVCLFRTLPPEEQAAVVEEGRPRPSLPLLSYPLEDPKGGPTRKQWFHNSLYDQHPWLAGSETLKALYCWPCLLFAEQGASRWNSALGADADTLLAELKRHPATEEHVRACLDLLHFERGRAPDPTGTDAGLLSALARRNRRVARRVIDATLFALQRKPPPGRGNWALTPAELARAHRFLTCPGADPDVAEDAGFLLSRVGSAAAVGASCRVLRRVVRQEVQRCQVLSVLVSGHATSGAPLRSVVLRYAGGGRAVERFVGYQAVAAPDPSGSPAAQLLKDVSGVLKDVGFNQRYVAALSVDGSVPLDVVEGLYKDLSGTLAIAHLAPAHSHSFWTCLAQSLAAERQFGDLNCFFKLLESLVSFLRERGMAPSRTWNQALAERSLVYHPWTLESLLGSRVSLLLTLSYRLQSEDEVLTVQVLAYHEFLSSVSTVFWIALLARIFRLTAEVHGALEETSSALFDQRLCSSTLLDLAEERRFGPYTLLHQVSKALGHNETDAARLATNEECRLLFQGALEWTSRFVEARLRHLPRLRFVDLFSLAQHSAEASKGMFEVASEAYANLFPSSLALCNELLALSSAIDPPPSGFEQALAYLSRYPSRQRRCYNLARLAELALALPLRPAAGARLASAVRAWAEAGSAPGFGADASLLRVEGDFLAELRSSDAFNEEVVDCFLEELPKESVLQGALLH